ncbi:MAG TPA: hypothetical protein VHG91_01840 [Longimicrobium sp.]|nr:hypothetical protein [Longimicrobium sp.]
MNPTRRAPLAVVLAVLAFVCLGAGVRADATGGVAPGAPAWTRGGGSERRVETKHALALLHLRHGAPGARLAPRGSGAAPPGPSFVTRLPLPRFAGRRPDAPLPAVLRPAYARAAAAARDGTLSSRSNGVPPPALA